MCVRNPILVCAVWGNPYVSTCRCAVWYRRKVSGANSQNRQAERIKRKALPVGARVVVAAGDGARVSVRRLKQRGEERNHGSAAYGAAVAEGAMRS